MKTKRITKILAPAVLAVSLIFMNTIISDAQHRNQQRTRARRGHTQGQIEIICSFSLPEWIWKSGQPSFLIKPVIAK